jgi:hypothetical protein
MKRLYLILIFLPQLNISFCQTSQSDNYILWSSTRKLTINDFAIKTTNKTSPSFAQFSVDYEIKGFDFMTKNFNKKVHNYVIKSASWIDTTFDVAQTLRYQQTLWNICEIYTRRFRKELKDNRKKIASGTGFIKDLNAKIMADFSNRRMDYDAATDFGLNNEKQKEWEVQIQKELDELKDFSLE